MIDSLSHLPDTSDIAARWDYGRRAGGLVWMHVLSDLGIGAACVCVAVLLGLALRRRTVRHRSALLLSGAFLLLCGGAHLMEAAGFWWPAYPLAGAIKFAGALVAWTTVAALTPAVLQVLGVRGSTEPDAEVSGRTEDLRRSNEALHEREERLQAILDTAADAIITIDAAGSIERFNPAAERMFGYAAAEAVGRNVNLLMPSPTREEHDRYLARYFDTGERRVIGTVRRLVARRKDGTRFPIELAVSEIGHSRRFTGIIRDVSERESLQRELLTIAEDEKRRIGEDLHDDIGQELTGLGLTAETLLEALTEYRLPEAEVAARMVTALRRTHEKVRQLSRGLAPVEFGTEALMAALSDLAAGVRTMNEIDCAFECESPVPVPDDGVGTQLFRIAQEAVSNAVRHGFPQRIRISLSADEGRVTLAVRDDGIGSTRDAGASPGGLRIMRHRAELIGGALEVGPAPGGGTQVVCAVPRRA